MSEPTVDRGAELGRALGRAPLQLAPWFAMAAMAAAALWPRAKKLAHIVEKPRAPTPAELDACEPRRGRCARSPLAIPPLGWKDILWRT